MTFILGIDSNEYKCFILQLTNVIVRDIDANNLATLFFQIMGYRACSFCENTTKNSNKTILKLSKSMLSQLGASKTADYYCCTDELEGGEENIVEGTRKRWRGEPRFKVEEDYEGWQHISNCVA